MNKKIQLFCLAILSCFYLGAQTSPKPAATCATGIPPQQWEDWMQEKIKKYEEDKASSKQIVLHTIPVIVHVIHFGEALGVYPNVDTNVIKSQIAVLNEDFAGAGFSSNNVPAVFANLKTNTGIRFCRAKFDPLDAPLAAPGVDRVNANSNSWLSPNTPSLDVYNYFRTVIMPGTIWPPDKYLNIWISDKPQEFLPNGFATYPPGTTLTGLHNGPVGTISNDGVWIYAATFGTVGVVQRPFHRGRTCTHEVGHWLGLRHMWGDGNCLSDYVGDTPYHKGPNYGCVATPTQTDICGVNTAPFGEMPMNFMDRSDDSCMYMFTPDQNVRMQTAMSNSPFRYLLGSHNKCNYEPAPPNTAAFSAFKLDAKQCVNSPFIPFNTSSGYPPPVYGWQVTPGAQITPNQTVPNPAITFNAPGQYTVTLTASNNSGSSTSSMVVTATGTCAPFPACIDTIRMIRKIDTLATYRAPNGSQTGCITGPTGYYTGTNCYRDKEVAQFFPPSSYTSTPHPQVNSVIVLFDSVGTSATNTNSPINCKIYGGNVTSGPISFIVQKSATIDTIIKTPTVKFVGYVGKPGQTPLRNTKIIAYKFDFNTPVVINNASGFYVSVELPLNHQQDSLNIYSNSRYNSANDTSAWFYSVNGSWRTYKKERGFGVRLAILPQITCGPVVGVEENVNSLSSNVMLMPNPNNGLFNLIFTLKKEQEINIRVFTSVGQEIINNNMKNVLNNMIDMDLSAYPDGIYFAEISNGQEKIVKKIVLAH